MKAFHLPPINTVSNSGTISVPLSKVGLGSGERVTLDLSGDGFLQVAVPTAATATLIKNSGTITANGGRVEIRAATARERWRYRLDHGATASHPSKRL
jgi:large exoprotein involved in heme utilization and adhesion